MSPFYTIDLFTEEDTHRLIEYIEEQQLKDFPLFIWIDLFCGAGGVTHGVGKAPNHFVVGCVNHDEKAIESHHRNNPNCIHYIEDVRNWDVIYKIENLIKTLRQAFPYANVVLHASMECTHISKAKGGLPRDADSRTLMLHLYNYLSIEPDFITIENVEEILTMGPLNENGMPCKELAGLDYNLWVEEITNEGYDYDYRKLNSADYGESTSRTRYIGIFAKHGKKIVFPEPTHVSRKKKHLHPDRKIHEPAYKKIDLSNYGASVFGFNKVGKYYVDATIDRVYYGLIKHYREGVFSIRYNGGDMRNKNRSLMEPIGTILTNNTHSIVTPLFLSSYYGNSKNGQGVHSLHDPINTITTKDTFSVHFMQMAYGNPCYSNLKEPTHTITTNPKQELITAKWFFDTQYDRVGNSVKKPCPTIIARQDKKPLYLASTTNLGAFPPFMDQTYDRPDDTPAKRRLRDLMRYLGISDVFIRSLEVQELKELQGFDPDYILMGTKTQNKKFIGNSVTPKLATALAKSLTQSIINN